MARQVEETIICDLPDCRKQPSAAANDHVAITVSHTYPEGVPSLVAPSPHAGQALDFCCFDHASKYLAEAGKERAAAAKEAVQRQAQIDRERTEAEAEMARQREEDEKAARDQ